MKTCSATVLGLLFTLAAVPQLGAAPQFGRERSQNRDRVCVYQDVRYQGWEQCYTAGDEVANLSGRKDAISSIRVYGRARVTVYDDENFRGRSAEFGSDVPDLGLRSLSGSKSWSDHIQSLRVLGEGDNRPGNNPPFGNNAPPIFGNPNRNPEQQVNDGVCVYDRPNYQGRSQCWNAGQDAGDLGRLGGWSDRISSIRVFGGASVVVYRDIGFRGDSIVIDRDVSDLGQIPGRGFRNWDGQISSLQVEDRRGGRSRGRGRF